ncbi:hypothetical protein KI688_012250 [Linnemannia hyalina]|uniref:Ras-GEF domain-containing protein n=1 Tax=Linnemannia hyalina TaxID=64524 RepID=A0A9P8BW05_9FUNG|nr:hypothetical protein KI688_012250 [Linnemannia hyalina]
MTLDRERDLSKYATLLTAAKAEQGRGDLKAAYATYLEAHGVIIHILSSKVVFKDKDSLESAPGNYTQLLAHAQEILRRLKDIVDLSKSHESLSSSSPAVPTSTSSAKSSKPSSISPPIRPGLGPSRPSQRSVATTATNTTQNYKRTRKNIPMIPISPLTKQSLLHSYALSQVTQKLEQAKQGSNPQQQQQHQQSGAGSPSLSGNRDLAHLRRLIEDVRIQRAKLDTVSIQIQSVASSNITSWDPDTIAKQLTIIDTQLFKDVAIPRDLVRADRHHHNSRAQTCIDFENYIAHSFSHLLLLEWITVRQASPASSQAASKNHSHVPVNAVAHTIRIAYILLHVYRNFNGFRALMRALTSPEIKRMHKLWSGVPSKTKDTYRRLVAIYQDQAAEGGYKGALIQKLDAFQDVGRDAMVAIPWMRYHQDEVKSIIQSYLTGQESSGGSTDIVLSAPGARKLSAVTALLLQCKSNDPGNFDRQETDSRSGTVSHTKHREPVQVDGLKTPLSPVWDLISLGAGDVTLHHWLLSRPFLNKQQLIDESLEIEPLFNGEELPVHETSMDLDESDDSASLAGDVDQDESFEQVIQPEHDFEPSSAPLTPTQSSTRPAWTRTPVSESEVNDIMNELLNDDANDSRGLFGDSDDDNNNNNNNNNNSPSPSGSSRPGMARGASGSSFTKSPQRTRDVFEFLGIQPEDASDDDDETGGDLGTPTSSSFKNKGKALWSGDDDDELDSLMTKVKGLVHESKAFTQDVESKPESVKSPQNDFDNDPWGKEDDDGDKPHSSEKKFEPFQQGNEEDEWGFGDSPAAPVATSTLSEPAPSAMSTLDALRKQFASLGPVPVSDDIADDSLSPKSEPSADSNSKDDQDTTKTILITAGESPVSAESALSPPSSASGPGSAATSPSALSSSFNPFAPFMMAKPAGSGDSHSPPHVIGKARKRKILVDRSGHVNHDLAAEAAGVGAGSGFPGDKTPTALSPPKHVVGPLSPLEASDETMAAIAAKAKMSLAGFLSGSHPSPTDAENKDSPQDGDADVVSPSSKSAASVGSKSGSSDEVASVSIQELDKLAALFRSIDVKFTLTVDDSSDDDGGGDDEEFSCSTDFHANEDDELSSHHQQQRQEETGESNSANSHAEEERSKSPRSDHEGAGGLGGEHGSLDSRTRANRQRRRIAGGVISLTTTSKTLVSMKSTSSLSNAFMESSSSSVATGAVHRSEDDIHHTVEHEHELEHELEHEQGQEQDETQITTAATAEEVEGGGGDDVEATRTTKNGDLVTEAMMADVEADVTIDEANSLLKSPLVPVASIVAQKDEDETVETNR